MARFLVQHDYGMGALSWWIEAPSADDIVRTFAEVVIVPDADEDDLLTAPFIVLGQATYPPGLAELRDQRAAQLTQPGFGALAGRGTVYLKRTDPDYPSVTYLTEHDENGYRTRQVMADSGDGTSERSSDWLFNPPEDLWDPDLAACEISRDEFEEAWRRAGE